MRLFSTEQVSKWHSDKYADQISDAIVTACLQEDKNAHCAVETLVKDKFVVIAGEVTTKADVNYEAIVRRVAKKLGYKCQKIINLISKQSPEINNAVISDKDIGAGDQGIMFGYATDETDSMLPYGFDLANKIIEKLEIASDRQHTMLKGDAKTQVTVDIDTNEIYEVLVSVCHKENYTLEEVKDYVKGILEELVPEDKLLINPSGTWTIGGPEADCGLTGRKIVCDQYGGYAPVGGGAFSGKDPTKVDRSASYMARKIAKDLVKQGNHWAKVQLGYAIGVSQPMSVIAETDNGDYSKWVKDNYDLTPKGIINTLDLLNVDYEKLAEGCHYRKQ